MCGLKYYGYHCGDYYSNYDVGVFFQLNYKHKKA